MSPSFKTLASRGLEVSSIAVRLFSAHSDGNVSSLFLQQGNNGSFVLDVTSVTSECEKNPAALSLDLASNVLYCYDRGGSSDTEGSLNSFAITGDGTLNRIARVKGPPSGVWGELVVTESGNRSYVSASYNASAVGVFLLGDDGALPGTGPIQTIIPDPLEVEGVVPGRQDRSYLHHVIVDPTNEYILFPDLGGDRIRVFGFNQYTDIIPLKELAPLRTDAGVGPRHGFIHQNEAGDSFLFFSGELSQKVYSYKLTYGDGLEWEPVFDAPALGPGNELPATTAPTSECAVTPDGKFLIVSHREVSFKDSTIFGSGPSDTLSTWAINEDGTLTFVQNAPSGGWSPRQFSLNREGDMIAVGHQVNKTVVIWKRDVVTGEILSEADGGKVAEVALSGAVVATIWDEGAPTEGSHA